MNNSSQDLNEVEKSLLIDKKLTTEREHWNNEIKAIVKMLRHVTDVSEAQVLMLSYRHQMIDKIVDLKKLVSKQKGKYWESHKEVYRKYKTKYDLKLNSTEINDFIKADKKDHLYRIELLEGQIQYYQGTVDTLDKMGFAIKNKLALEQNF